MQFFSTIAVAFACLAMASANPLEKRCAGNLSGCGTNSDCCAGLQCTGILFGKSVCQTGA
ncbi:hypothetical protein FIBSPDRAFT_957642 [Athelia psychrophila]|uniref:Uncharacterized protein n=1 Tax=Athelia psychrophila TaxID=1759441 RepID=A0A166FLK9_9AGAM|nr:hypothetical protein FIBSPDRAFT_957642 [Fibularhizoctonia sp. CBS 109695]